MSEFDVGNCNEICRYSQNPDMGTCKKCAEEYDMPHLWCCLEWCGELEFCRGCKNGIYKERLKDFEMSMIEHQVKELRELADCYHGEIKHHVSTILQAADTIEALSAKLAAANMERSDRYYGGGWQPISEYSRDKYDWVLIKYFDGEEECVPQVAELRSDGKWYVSTDFDRDFVIPTHFDVRYFFDMKQLDRS